MVAQVQALSDRLADVPVRRDLLLIEDNPGDASLVSAHLMELDEGFSVTVATRLDQALTLISARDFQLVLADLSLPDSRGVSTVNRLLSACGTTSPLVVLSGLADELVANQAVKMGAQDYLLKSKLEADTLGRSIRYAIERHRSQSDLNCLLRNNPDGTLVVGEDGNILFCNPAAAHILGGRPQDFTGAPFEGPLDRDAPRSVRLSSGRWAEIRVMGTTWEGEPAWAVALQDTTERRRTEERLAYLAHYDQLTGLANRSLFQERLQRTLVRCGREGHSFAVFAFDVDRFKSINDDLGHDVGDRVLAEVAVRLKSLTRESDTLARVGGDEFILIAEGVENARGARMVAEKVISAFLTPFQVGERRVKVTTSVGIAMYPRDGVDAETLLAGADAAMYRSKEAGRARYCFLDPVTQCDSIESRRTESELRCALSKGEIEVFYQPIFGSGKGSELRKVGVEALVRWNHPERGMVSPAMFLSTLEQTGLIVEVGEWVIRTACEQAAVWRTGDPSLRLSVNVSQRQLLDKDFVTKIRNILAETGFPAASLELEITESTLLVEDDDQGVLAHLHELGVCVALDDFGIGYSSLARLSKIPAISTIKIDSSFVQAIGTCPASDSMVIAILGLGRSMGVNMVAEGVEKQDQLDFLSDQGCQEFQGYLLAPPLPSEAWTSED